MLCRCTSYMWETSWTHYQTLDERKGFRLFCFRKYTPSNNNCRRLKLQETFQCWLHHRTPHSHCFPVTHWKCQGVLQIPPFLSICGIFNRFLCKLATSETIGLLMKITFFCFIVWVVQFSPMTQFGLNGIILALFWEIEKFASVANSLLILS